MPTENAVHPMTDCPDRKSLLAYAQGKVPSRELDAFASHVDACRVCQSSLMEMRPDTLDDDSLVAELRRCVAPKPQVDSALDTASLAADNVGGGPAAATVADTPAGPAAPRSSLPRLFGRYELLEEIGRGGMGVVYRARQKGLNRLVALKLIRTGTEAGPDETKRFRTEGEAMARLQHPHVVQIHDFDEVDGQFYLAMEHIEGGRLSDRLQGKGLPLRQAAELVRTLAEAVHAAHQRNIIHRDLKPSNVLLAPMGMEGVQAIGAIERMPLDKMQPKIADFGLAKLQDSETTQTAPDAILGTPCYMAPEQADGDSKRIGLLTDVYALGAILYEALTGRPPFKAPSRMETLDLVRKSELVFPRDLRREMPRDLEAICLKCLAKEPARRYRSAQALAEDLGCWLRGEHTEARPWRWYRRAWRRLPRPARAAVVLVPLGIAVLLSVVLWPKPDPDAALKEIEVSLQKGQSVTLIDENRGPAWSHFLTGENATRTTIGPDGSFVVNTWKAACLELLRDPQVDHYKIHAQLRHDNGDIQGQIGLFCSAKHYALGKDTVHYVVHLTFGDVSSEAEDLLSELPANAVRPKVSDKNRVHLAPYLYIDGAGEPVDQLFKGLEPRLFRFAGRGMEWRQLTLEVTPQGVSAVWDGQAALGVLSKDTMDGITAMALEGKRKKGGRGALPKESTPKFDPRSPCGIYVYKSVASFRHVVIEPILE